MIISPKLRKNIGFSSAIFFMIIACLGLIFANSMNMYFYTLYCFMLAIVFIMLALDARRDIINKAVLEYLRDSGTAQQIKIMENFLEEKNAIQKT